MHADGEWEKATAASDRAIDFFDLAAYERYLEGRLEDYEYPEEKIKEALKEVPEVKEPTE